MAEALAPASSGGPLLHLDGVKRSFKQGDRRLDVLVGADAELRGGEAVALVGPSGAGKSTLLHIAGLLERPDAGRVLIGGRDCTGMDDGARTRIRRIEMGFVYQFHQLLPEFSALENVAIPHMLAGNSRRASGERAKTLLTSLGLAERLDHRPAELSGGEQQRTAIARALANGPKVILADEPTGNLDPTTAGTVFEDLLRMIERSKVAALIATHNLELASRMHRVLRLEGGRLVEVSPSRVAAARAPI